MLKSISLICFLFILVLSGCSTNSRYIAQFEEDKEVKKEEKRHHYEPMRQAYERDY